MHFLVRSFFNFVMERYLGPQEAVRTLASPIFVSEVNESQSPLGHGIFMKFRKFYSVR